MEDKKRGEDGRQNVRHLYLSEIHFSVCYKKRKGNSKKLSSARQTTANNKLLKSIPSAAFSDQAQVNVAI